VVGTVFIGGGLPFISRYSATIQPACPSTSMRAQKRSPPLRFGPSRSVNGVPSARRTIRSASSEGAARSHTPSPPVP